MFLLVTGASGAGKSTARRSVVGVLPSDIVCVELRDVTSVPSFPTLEWRHRATEAAVQRALQLQAEGRHLLLSGDPVAAGEVLAAPSASSLDAVAVCLLDVSADAQTDRLTRRGDDPALFEHHHAFADWMRGHARDPRYMPHVLTTNGWEAMRWERLIGIDPSEVSWRMEIVDTSHQSPAQVAARIVTWCRRALAGQAPTLTARTGPTSPTQ